MSELLASLPSIFTPPIAESVLSMSTSSVPTSVVSKMIKVPIWTDDQQPLSYLTKFEKAMSCNGEPKTRWAHLLPMFISGKLECAYTLKSCQIFWTIIANAVQCRL